MVAFVFDRRSLVLLGTGAVFLALVLVAVGFLLGVQYGVLPPAAPQNAAIPAAPAAALARVTGMVSDAGASEPGWGLASSEAEPAEGEDSAGLLDRSAPESLPYTHAPTEGGPTADEDSPAPAAPRSALSTPRESGERGPAASPMPTDLPADPIVDSRGGEPVPLAPSPRSVPESSGTGTQAESSSPTAPEAPLAVAAAATTDSGRFAVQVGAYRERLNCDAMVQKLAARGFQAYVVEVERDGQPPLFAVRVGRFGDRASAAKEASALRSRAGVSVVVLSIG